MDNIQAYNHWAGNYDTVINKTRDLEAIALRQTLLNIPFDSVLEIGCGTGKNTEWLLTKAKRIVGADFSEKMLEKAKLKIQNEKVAFQHTDIREKWTFGEAQFDLITCSLVLEHIENLDFVFRQAKQVLQAGGFFYVGELHPFKQYQGSKARFDTENGVFELECFIHNVSDYYKAGKDNNFECVALQEWFDNKEDKLVIPRLLTLLYHST